MISFDKRELPQLVIPWIFDDWTRALCALCYMVQQNPRIVVNVQHDYILWASEKAAKLADHWFDLGLVQVVTTRV